jgi:NAD(P)-dependent dehydrogenase (short-subunit alcohol dehydrogenase family)
LANILFTYELARRLAGSGITANCLHPGSVNTRFGRDGDLAGWVGKATGVFFSLFGIAPERGADTVVYLASSPEVAGVTGKYFDKRKAVRSSHESYDEAVAQRLWQVSEQLCAPLWRDNPS